MIDVLSSPVRFAGWGPDGRPLGRPVQAPYIPCAATEEGQAGHVYQAAVFMLQEGAVSATAGLDVGLTRTFLPGGGVIRPVTARATSKEGGRESFAVFDETSLFVSPELERLHQTIRRNLAKRKSEIDPQAVIDAQDNVFPDCGLESGKSCFDTISAGR